MKRYTDRVPIPACVLKPEDLLKLETLILQDLAKDAEFSINATVGAVEIETANVAEFLQQPELPDVLHECMMSGRDDEQHVAVHIYTVLGLTGDVTIDGTNEAWVRGTGMRFQDFFDRRRKRRNVVWALLASSWFVALTFGVGLVALVRLIAYPQAIPNVPLLAEPLVASIIWAYLARRYIGWLLVPRTRTVAIIIRPHQNWVRDKDNREVAVFIVLLLTLLAMVAGLFR